jgi:hypothetical protein
MADDYKNDSSTSATLSLGSQITGNIEEAADKDWFKVTLNAGTTSLLSDTFHNKISWLAEAPCF